MTDQKPDDNANPFGEEVSSQAHGVPFGTERQNSEDTFSYPELPLADQLAAEESLDAFGSETSDTLFDDDAGFSLSDEENRPAWEAGSMQADPRLKINDNEEVEPSPFAAPSIPPKDPEIPACGQPVQSQNSNFASVLGVLAILATAIVYWLNMGLAERVVDLETLPYPEVNQMLKIEAQIQALNQKIKASEQQHAQQSKTLEKKINDSEQQRIQQVRTLKQHANAISLKLDGLSGKVAKLAASKPERSISKRIPAPIKPVKKVIIKPIVPVNRSTAAAVVSRLAPAHAAKKKASAEDDFDPFVPMHAPVATPIPVKGGEYTIILRSMSSEKAAVKELTRIRAMGIAAESSAVQIKGKTWYRIRVPGFADIQEAQEQKKALSKKLGIHDAWIGKGK